MPTQNEAYKSPEVQVAVGTTQEPTAEVKEVPVTA